jgi:hypothetical protein
MARKRRSLATVVVEPKKKESQPEKRAHKWPKRILLYCKQFPTGRVFDENNEPELIQQRLREGWVFTPDDIDK